jgi:hypothetical protein
MFISFILTNMHFHILANMRLGVIKLHCCARAFSGKEGGIEVLVGLTQSKQTIVSLFRIPWPAKPTRKMIVLNYF